MSEPTEAGVGGATPRPAKNTRNWKWFFAVLITLTLLATGSLVVYNQRQQLRFEEFEANRDLWNERGPASYDLVYTQKFTSRDGSSSTNEYAVKVRDKKVIEVLVNGIPKEKRLDYHDMRSIFNDIERFFRLDEKENRKVFRKASFDPDSGAVRSYVRRVMGTTERQEITVGTLERR